MAGKREPLRSWLTRLAGRGFSRPRRRLILTFAAIAGGAATWIRLARPPQFTDAQIIASVCDRLLPAAGANPGARALGIDRILVESHQQDDSRLGQLVAVMRQHDFVTLDDSAKDALLHELFNDRADRQIARTLRSTLDFLVRYYYVRPEAWATLDYRQPQPQGYPDYARCSGERP